MKRTIGIIWIVLGISALLFETIYVLATRITSGVLVVGAAGLAMLWQGITMYRNAKRAANKDK